MTDCGMNSLVSTIDNRGQRELSSNARRLVEEKYSWKVQADRLEKVYLYAIDCKKAP